PGAARWSRGTPSPAARGGRGREEGGRRPWGRLACELLHLPDEPAGAVPQPYLPTGLFSPPARTRGRVPASNLTNAGDGGGICLSHPPGSCVFECAMKSAIACTWTISVSGRKASERQVFRSQRLLL